MHAFEIHVTPEMTRRAWNSWFFAKGSHWKIGLAALLILGGAWMDGAGDGARPLSTVSIVTLTTLGLALLLFSVVYIVGLRRALARLAGIPDGRCRYTLTDAAIETASSLGSVSLVWPAITEIARAGDLVRLHFASSGYAILPTAQVPPEALAFLVAKARAHGAKITGL